MKGKHSKRPWIVAALITAFICLVVASPFLLLWFTERASHWKYRKVIRREYEERVVPAASWVESFARSEHRLPTDDEMRAQLGNRMVGIYREPPPWQHTWGVLGQDFMVCYPVGEWNLYYCSWDKRRIEAWTD